MKEYLKPIIEEERIELEDIIAVSGGLQSVSPENITDDVDTDTITI